MTITSNKSMAFWALLSGVVLLFTGMFIAPEGEIHSSVLIGAGELVLGCLILAGFGEVVNKFLECLNELKAIKLEREEKA